jgi:predicted glycosyltransferase
MPERSPRRLLIYSHDSFGLGHLRRCRSIAQSLIARDPGLSVRILSGLPLVARFEFDPRIHITLVPAIIKQKSGDYRAVAPDQDLSEAIEARARIIRETAEAYKPSLMLVDKEPLGIRGEMLPTLKFLKERGVPIILGLRDVMDEPTRLSQEWDRKQSTEAVESFYGELWIYGLPQFYDPLLGIELSEAVRERIVYTSYLRRNEAVPRPSLAAGAAPERPFLLITPGGGGDGEDMVDWVLSARETVSRRRLEPLPPMKIVCGPFMSAKRRAEFERRAARLVDVTFADFAPNLESLLAMAAGVVAMGGYNTFCEILSYDRPALIVPRTEPRLEQAIRAERAAALGLVAALADDGVRDPLAMVKALRALTGQPRPSSVTIPGLLEGHEAIARRVDHWFRRQPSPDWPGPADHRAAVAASDACSVL